MEVGWDDSWKGLMGAGDRCVKGGGSVGNGKRSGSTAGSKACFPVSGVAAAASCPGAAAYFWTDVAAWSSSHVLYGIAAGREMGVVWFSGRLGDTGMRLPVRARVANMARRAGESSWGKTWSREERRSTSAVAGDGEVTEAGGAGDGMGFTE